MINDVPHHLLFPVRTEPLRFYPDDPEIYDKQGEEVWRQSGAHGVILKNTETELEQCVGIVSPRYDLITNHMLLDVLNEVSEEIGIDFKYSRHLAGEKMSGYRFHQYYMPFVADIELDIKDENGSLYNPVIEIKNSYDGSMSWGMEVCGTRLTPVKYKAKEGIYESQLYFYVVRQICSNGMMGKVEIQLEEAETDEEVYIGERMKRIGTKEVERERMEVKKERTTVIRNVKHIKRKNPISQKEMVRKILEGFANNSIISRHISLCYEKVSRKWFEAFLKFVEKTNKPDRELLQPITTLPINFQLVQLITSTLTTVIKARSFERYKLYNQKLWETLK